MIMEPTPSVCRAAPPRRWAQGELKSSIGLAQRFVFSFGAVRQPGKPQWQQFEEGVVRPVLERLFSAVLQHLGPKTAMQETSAQKTWHLTARLREEVHQYRLAAFDCNKRTQFGEVFASGLNKSVYWIGATATLCSILEEAWPSVLQTEQKPVEWSGAISECSLKQAMTFFQERYLFGLATLDVETRRLQNKKAPSFPESKSQASRCTRAESHLYMLYRSSGSRTREGRVERKRERERARESQRERERERPLKPGRRKTEKESERERERESEREREREGERKTERERGREGASGSAMLREAIRCHAGRPAGRPASCGFSRTVLEDEVVPTSWRPKMLLGRVPPCKPTKTPSVCWNCTVSAHRLMTGKRTKPGSTKAGFRT